MGLGRVFLIIATVMFFVAALLELVGGARESIPLLLYGGLGFFALGHVT